MIGISVSDILKILDQIPIWKALRELPKRVTELEAKVQNLEEQKTANILKPNGRECPICGGAMKVTHEAAHPHFAFAGVKIHKMKCEICGTETTRDYKPGEGYR